MPLKKSSKVRMQEEVEKAIASGNSYLANEITANVMVGTTMLIVFIVMFIALILNEVGVFSADKSLMRWAVIIASFIEVPITILNTKHVGTKSWLKFPLMIDLTLVCAIMSATLGHNVTLVMVFPMVVSTRYFDEKYTLWVAIFTAITFAVSNVFCAFFGIINLNMVKFNDITEVINISIAKGQTLRDAIIDGGYLHKAEYVKSLFVNEFIPRCAIFLALSSSCRFVASRGKKMIEMESDNVKKTSRIETELDLATRIQSSMLPCIFPAFPSHENIDLRATYHPAKEVGGDFYDYFVIDKSHVGVVIADVSGKGVGAALFMTISKTVLKNQLQLGITPAQALTNANSQLCETNDAGLFVTCWAGVYDIDSGKLTFVNAGHNPPVIIRKDNKPEFIKQHSGFVLAGMEGFKYKEEEITLNKGDEMFFYTDGVTEATDTHNELFGEDRLLECLDKCKGKVLADQLLDVKTDIDRFVKGAEQFDDITMMVMHIN